MKIKHLLVRAGRKIIGVALCLVMIFTTFFIFDPSVLSGLFPRANAVDYSYATTTGGSSYGLTRSGNTVTISTGNGFAYFISNMTSYNGCTVNLECNVCFNSGVTYSFTNSENSRWYGTFNGNNHYIKDYKYKYDGDAGRSILHPSIFRNVAGGTTIRDLNIENPDMFVWLKREDYTARAGVLIGEVYGSGTVNIDNVKISGGQLNLHSDDGAKKSVENGGIVGLISQEGGSLTVNFKDCKTTNLGVQNYSDTQYYARYNGGFVGKVNSATINISNTSKSLSVEGGQVYHDGSGDEGHGGLIGYTSGSTTITNVITKGTVYSGLSGGGMIGIAAGSVTITNSENQGSVIVNKNNGGGLIGLANSSVTITNSANTGSVTGGTTDTGGFIGKAVGYVKIENSTNSGKVTGSDVTVGGFIGWLANGGNSTVLTNCTNTGTITGNGNDGYVGGVVGSDDGTSSITVSGCINNGTISGKRYIGGIFGKTTGSRSSLTFSGCTNNGSVTSTRTDDDAAGGIIGRFQVDQPLYVTNCTNTGTVKCGHNYGGGIVGYCKGYLYATGCVNSGTVSGSGYTGGICGEIEDDRSTFTNCSNSGKVTGTNECIGGILGKTGGVLYLTGCSNSGEITASNSWCGGIVGCLYNDTGIDETVGLQKMVFENLSNSGYVHAGGDRIGGIIGGNKGHGKWVNCSNTGAITSTGTGGGTYVGGIVGWIEDDMNNFEGCYNKGYVSGYFAAGGIVGYIGSNSNTYTMTSCYNLGNICGYSNYGHVGGLVGMFYGGTLNMSQCFNGDGQNGQIGSRNNLVHVGGGLIGFTSSTINITACYSHAPAIYATTTNSDDFTGGLIGKGCGSNTIKNSYAATNTTTGCYTGSIIGDTNNGSHDVGQTVSRTYYSTIFNSYSRKQGLAYADETFKGTTLLGTGCLNDGGSYYMQDTTGVNGYYPIFGWYKDNGNVKYDVLYDNQFDFDSYNFQGTTVQSSPIYRNCEENSITFTSHSADDYTNGQDAGTIAASPAQLNCMTLIPGHTYRVSYTFTTDKAANVNFYLFANTSNTSFNWQGTNFESTIDSAGTKSVSGTYTIPSGRPYVTIRCGTTTNGVTVKFKDIYIQDITNIAGQTDNVSTPDPKLNTVGYNGSVSSFPSITRSGYTFRGWSTTKDSTTGNGNPSNIVTSLSSITKNQQLYSCWSPAVYFDPNDGTSKVNLLTQPTTRKSNDLYSPTLTSSPGNGVTATFDQTDSTITFNGTPTRDAEYFRFPIAGKLKADTNYTYRVVYVSGSKTLDGGTLTLTMDICDKNESTCFKASGTTYSDRFVFDQFANQETTWRTLAPDAYQAANAEFVKIFTYSTSYGTVKYNNYKVKVELVESDSANQTYSPNAIQQYYNSQLGTLPTPTRTGYTFDGWYTAASGGTQITSSTTMGKSSMTAYAHWTPKTYTLTFDGNGGTPNASAVTVTYDSTDYYDVHWLYPSRTGYTFAGWYTEKEGGTQVYGADGKCIPGTKYWDSNSKWCYDGNLTVYAHWDINQYTIDLNGYFTDLSSPLIGGMNDTDPDTNAVIPAVKANVSVTGQTAMNATYDYCVGGIDYGKSFTISGFTAQTGYVFEGLKELNTTDYKLQTWDASTKTYSGYVGYGGYNTKIAAQFRRAKFTIAYNINGGSGQPESTSATFNVANSITSTVPTRTGYTFAGWKAGNGTIYTKGQSLTATNVRDLYKNNSGSDGGAITLTAVWTQHSYLIEYSMNNGTNNSSNVAKADFDSVITLYRPTKAGWVFTGWSLEGTNPDYSTAKYGTSSGSVTTAITKSSTRFGANGTVYIKNLSSTDGGKVKLVAHWEKTLTANFYSGIKMANNQSQSVTIYDSATSGTVTAPTTPTNPVWTFVGWTTEKTAAASTKFINGGASVTITATTADNTYVDYFCLSKQLHTLNYNANGGTGAPGSSTAYGYYNSYGVQNNGSHTVSSTVPTRTGYTFVSWNTQSNGSGTEYSAGETYTNSAANDTLYAIWQANTYIVRFHSNYDADTTKDQTITFDKETALTANSFTRSGYTFGYWAAASDGSGNQYADKQSVKNLTSVKNGVVDLYAVWIKSEEAKDDSETYVDIKVTYGYDYVNNKALEFSLDAENIDGYDPTIYKTYKSAIDTYNNAKDAFVSTDLIKAKEYYDAVEALIKATAALDDMKVVSFLDKMTLSYNLNGKTETVTQTSVKDINLNHYTTETLDKIQSNFEEAFKNTGLKLKEQDKFNDYVKNVAEQCANISAVESSLTYDVHETAKAVKDQLSSEKSVEAVNYVYAGKNNYTYYCYTKSASPNIVINALEGSKINSTVAQDSRVAYPTRMSVVSEEQSGSISYTNKTESNIYNGYTNNGNYSIGNNYTGKVNEVSLTGANYYSTYTQVKLNPTFTTDKQTVSYTISATDDALATAETGLVSNSNYAKTANLAGSQKTTAVSENNITIIISYHNSQGTFCATPAQVGADVALNQYHLFRTSAGATNWELPKSGDSVYTVDHGNYGQCGLGSFTYTFTTTDSSDGYSFDLENCTATVPNGSTPNNVDKAQLLAAIIEELKTGVKDGTYTKLKEMTTKKFCSSEYETENEKTVVKSGTGVGYSEWGNNWSYNYYPQTDAFTYVHLVDRWGNTFDGVFCVGTMDYKDIYATSTTSSAGVYEILEAGGSGIDTLSLNAASMEILTDESSTLENNVYKTTSNTVKIQTGEANKSYTLTMKDKATNASTATLTSDENGIITLNVSDEAYTSGVYTFMLNDVEINLYDAVNNDKYIVKVNNGEAEEGDYAELSVVTTGEVGKVRFTDTDGNTITIASCEKNADGTKTWKMSKKRAAGEYKYSISVKVGYNWIEESSKGTLTFTAKILDSGVIRSAEYDAETGLYKITIEGRATKIQFITEDGMTRTYTRYNEFVKSKKTYDAEGNEVNDTARTLDHEIWLVDAKLYSGLKYTVAGKFEAGWNMNGTATMTAH